MTLETWISTKTTKVPGTLRWLQCCVITWNKSHRILSNLTVLTGPRCGKMSEDVITVWFWDHTITLPPGCQLQSRFNPQWPTDQANTARFYSAEACQAGVCSSGGTKCFSVCVCPRLSKVSRKCLTVAVIRGDSVCLILRLVNLVLVTRYILYYLWDKKSIFTVLCIYSAPAHKQSMVKDKTANAGYHFC